MMRCVFFLVLTASLFGEQWPTEPSNAIGAFAGAEQTHLRRGLRLSSPHRPVGAWADGEVIWISSGNRHDVGVPDAGMVVLEHPREFRSFYMGVEKVTVSDERVLSGEVIAHAGDRPWLFVIIDMKNDRLVNPLLMLPVRKEVESSLPDTVTLRRGNDVRTLLDGMSLSSGEWMVSVSGQNMRFMTISLFWMGRLTATLQFNALKEEGGRIVLESPENRFYGDVYDAEGRLLLGRITSNRGQGNLEIRFQDNTERVLNRIWRISVDQ